MSPLDHLTMHTNTIEHARIMLVSFMPLLCTQVHALHIVSVAGLTKDDSL